MNYKLNTQPYEKNEIIDKLPSDVVRSAKKLEIDVDSIISNAIEGSPDLNRIDQTIRNACDQKAQQVYRNLSANYPTHYFGIRDCYKRSE